MTTSTLTPDRQTFRQAVADVAARAKARLPEAVNGRVEHAVKLVLGHDVEPQDDGSILVGSSTDPLKFYRLVDSACECQDFVRGQAPDGWCQHRIAAGIHKRVQEQLPEAPAPVPVVPDLEPWPDNDPEPDAPALPSPSAPAPQPLPEAPASVNCHLTIAGRQVQLTLRDTDEGRLLARLATVLEQYPLPEPTKASPQPQPQLSPQQHNAAAMHRPVSGFCQVHGVAMKLNHGKDGRSWHSHWDEQAGRWCKGK